MSEMGIVGVVLAAGKSERMEDGRLKQLLPFGDRSMAAVVVAHAEASALDRVVVVTGRRSDEVRATLPPGRAVIVENPNYDDGNVSSLRCGLDQAEGAEAIVLLLGDMPGVTSDVIGDCVTHWKTHRPWAAHAVYADGAPNHPFVLSAAAVDALQETRGSKVLWRMLVEAPPQPVAQVRFDRPPPVDVDDLVAYGAALDQLGYREDG